MFRIYLTNMGYFTQDDYPTLDDAKQAGVALGFEFSVQLGNTVIGAWTVFGGWKQIVSDQMIEEVCAQVSQTILPKRKPTLTLTEEALSLLNSADSMARRYSTSFDDDSTVAHETFVQAYILGSLLHSPNRNVQFKALQMRFDYTDEQIAVDLIGG